MLLLLVVKVLLRKVLSQNGQEQSNEVLSTQIFTVSCSFVIVSFIRIGRFFAFFYHAIMSRLAHGASTTCSLRSNVKIKRQLVNGLHKTIWAPSHPLITVAFPILTVTDCRIDSERRCKVPNRAGGNQFTSPETGDRTYSAIIFYPRPLILTLEPEQQSTLETKYLDWNLQSRGKWYGSESRLVRLNRNSKIYLALDANSWLFQSHTSLH